MSDYIDKYKSARKNEFSSEEDEQARKDFWENAYRDIDWAKSNGLIKMMSFEDYMFGNSHTTVTEEMKEVIRHPANIPTWILSQFYNIHPSTVGRIKKNTEEA